MIPRELDAICATAMSKKRDERYLDAKALAADVKRSLAHQQGKLICLDGSMAQNTKEKLGFG
jgi:hypothetical protein